MSLETEPAGDPVEAAKWLAGSVALHEHSNNTTFEEYVLGGLDNLIDEWGLGGSYFVETGRAFSVPASFEADERVSLIDFYGVSFEGAFATFSIINIGKITSDYRVRALCASFGTALLLPYLDRIPEDHILHVPVLAVESIERTN